MEAEGTENQVESGMQDGEQIRGRGAFLLRLFSEQTDEFSE